MGTFKIERPANILLVEDNEGDVKLIKEAMADAGFHNRTIVAEDGTKAMDHLKKESPDNIDIVILDLNLPGKDGRDVLKEIKSDERLKHIPVVVLTSSSSEEDIVKCYNLYANCFITKPLELSEYQDVVKRIETFWLSLARLPKKKAAILLIEDNPADIKLVEELLSERGVMDYEIDTAGRLKEGFEKLENGKHDLVLLDLNLPDSKGFETFQKMYAKFPATPIVIFTGLSDAELGTRAVQEGAQSYILKKDLSSVYLENTIKYSIERNKIKLAAEELMNVIVHELRTPMAIIKEGSHQIIEGLHGKVSDKQKEFLNMIFANSEKMEAMITELLEMARINIGNLRLDVAEYDLSKAVKRTFDEFNETNKRKEISLKLNIQKGDFIVQSDKVRITRVLTNLLMNAIKFTEKGTITLTLSDLGDKVLCSVEDTGVGMTPNETSEIFAKYQQSVASAKSRAKGIGLGLYICKSIIDLHNGVIYVESRLGKGSKFTFLLPKRQG